MNLKLTPGLNVMQRTGIAAAVLLLVVMSSFMHGKHVYGQIIPEYTVVEGVDPVALVQQHLIGQGVTTTNITYTGAMNAQGVFNGLSNIGIQSGILLTSGRANISKGPNNKADAGAPANTPGDSDLNQLLPAGRSSYDASILEFDFVPQSTIVEFRYVFASEEYPEYANNPSFNDVFGFFISGPGIYGPYSDSAQNIAVLPILSNPPVIVSINSINNGTTNNGPCQNCSYYVNNGNGSTPLANPYIQYDGFTTVLTARALVIPCETYHIKLAVADCGDRAYDSGVFLEANSFNSVGVQSSLAYTHAVVDTAVENCNTASLRFRIDNVRSEPFIIHYELTGTAVNGVDYVQIPDSVIIPVGQQEVSVDIVPIIDDIPEITKVVEIVYNTSFCEFIPDTARIWIKDYPEFFLNASNPQTIECGQTRFIRAGANGGIEPWTYEWNTGNPADTTDIISVSPPSSTTYTVIVRDVCGNEVTADIPFTVTGPTATINGGQSTVNICLNSSTVLSVEGGTSWLWSTGETTSSITVSPSSNTSYSVVVTDDCGNTNQSEIEVTVGQPFADAGIYDGICAGQSVDLIANDTPNGSWLWTNLTTGETYNGRIWTVSPPVTTDFSVAVTDDCGNTETDQTTINVFQLQAIAGTADPICTGGTATLNGSSSTGNGIFTWSDGTNVFSGPQVEVSPTETTTYTLTVDDGCIATDQLTLTVYPLPVVTANASVTAICPDDSFTLQAAGATTYTWTSIPPDPSISDPNSGNPTASPVTSTVYLYTVTGTDANGCVNTAQTAVNVKPRMYADFTASAADVCEGNALVLTYTGNGQSTATYDWSFDGGNATGSGNGPITVSWDNAGTKTISLTVTQQSCVSEAVQTTVNVNAMPAADFSTGITSGCVPLSVDFSDASANTVSGTTWSWDFGSAGSATGTSASTTFAEQGLYDVRLTVTNPGGCVSEKVVSALVDAWPNPVSAFETTPEVVSMKNPKVNFHSTSAGESLSFLWNTGDGITYSDSAFTHTYADSGYYQASLTVINKYGCPDVFEKTIFISPRYMLRIPNAFTPNGDGLNDEFKVNGNGVKEFRINIYNRWGALVYTSNDINESWKGETSGNKTLPGSYIYHIFFRDENDEVSEYQGSFFLMR